MTITFAKICHRDQKCVIFKTSFAIFQDAADGKVKGKYKGILFSRKLNIFLSQFIEYCEINIICILYNLVSRVDEFNSNFIPMLFCHPLYQNICVSLLFSSFFDILRNTDNGDCGITVLFCIIENFPFSVEPG